MSTYLTKLSLIISKMIRSKAIYFHYTRKLENIMFSTMFDHCLLDYVSNSVSTVYFYIDYYL